ncbi:histidine phosphatase family protein [Paenibacillus thalictri]|uniref:Histidine phosphatase family protein n=1 Tax=Paenibacillus thalictri TaxID=2527873 RepID=A0A4Q9DZ87_9BACL|nr:histidine phosphatase family protein [Paenibacillus thalictri]TBL81163.1 histidine phosphatase family protein [Paenibacillus thalictri]
MTTVTFVRHGNTDWNIENRVQGHMNNPLNHTGRAQAAAVAKRLAAEAWDVFYSSDLLRTRETAEIIATELKMPFIEYDARLREIGKGQLEGTIEKERIEKWGVNWEKLDLGVESIEFVRNRGVEFIEEMVVKHPGQKILVVSHGFFLAQLFDELLQDGGEDVLKNTSVTILEKKDDQWNYLLYNCTRHLESL